MVCNCVGDKCLFDPLQYSIHEGQNYPCSLKRNLRNICVSQVGNKIAGRNIRNLRYADDTTLMAESEVELNSLLMKVNEESEKFGLNLNIKKTNITSLHGKCCSLQGKCYSVAQSCPTLCNPMDCSMPGFPRALPTKSRGSPVYTVKENK